MNKKINTYNKLANNFIVIALGNIFSKSIEFLLLPLYARIFSKEIFGHIELINVTIIILVPLATLQITDAILTYSLRENSDKSEILTNSLFIGTISVLLSLFLYPLLIKINLLSVYIELFYAIVIITIFHNLLKAFLKGIDQVKIFSLSDIIYSIVLIIANYFLLIFYNLGIKGFLISILLSRSISLFFIIIKGKIIHYIDREKINYLFINKFIKFSLPLIPNMLNWYIIRISNRYIVLFFLGLAQTGIFSVAYKIPAIITILHTIFHQAWQITAIEEYDKDSKSKIFSEVFNSQTIFVIILVSFLLVILKPFVLLFASSEFFIAWRYIPILLLGSVFSTLSSFLGVAFLASENTNGAFYSSAVGAVSNIFIILIFINVINLYAAALAVTISFFVMFIIRFHMTKDYVEIKIKFSKLTPSFLILILQIIILMFTQNSYSVQVALFVLIFAINRKFLIFILQKSINYIRLTLKN